MLSPISYVSDCKDVDEIMSLKLDSEFRSKLEDLKPFILVLKSQEMARLSYLWVEKLCNCTNHEKLLRNKYLDLLFHQIKKNVLSPPFNQHPLGGELLPIEGLKENSYTDYSDSTTISCSRFLDAGDFNRNFKDNDFLQQNEKLENLCDSSCCLSVVSEWSSVSHSNQSPQCFEQNRSCALEEEINTLKERISRALEVKHVINGPSSTSIYPDMILHLENKLARVQQNAFNLKSSISTVEEQLEELLKQPKNCLVENCKIQRLAELYKNSLQLLQVEHNKDLIKFEKLKLEELAQKDEQYRHNLSETNKNFQRKIEEMQAQFEASAKHKDLEISQLSTTLESNCYRLKEEMSRMKSAIENQTKDEENVVVLHEKIAQLKMQLQKERQIRSKNEKLFEKRLKALVSETNRRHKMSKLRLVYQRTELMKKSVENSQEQINSAVVQLENRYRKLLFSQQSQFSVQQQQYIDAIAGLKAEYLLVKERNCFSQ